MAGPSRPAHGTCCWDADVAMPMRWARGLNLALQIQRGGSSTFHWHASKGWSGYWYRRNPACEFVVKFLGLMSPASAQKEHTYPLLKHRMLFGLAFSCAFPLLSACLAGAHTCKKLGHHWPFRVYGSHASCTQADGSWHAEPYTGGSA